MDRIPSKLIAGVGSLLEAFEYAVDVSCDRWTFAVSIAHLESLGCTESDFRWLICKGYLEHAREVTAEHDDRRDFLPSAELTFSRNSCFVLTDAGVFAARTVFGLRPKRCISERGGQILACDVSRAPFSDNGREQRQGCTESLEPKRNDLTPTEDARNEGDVEPVPEWNLEARTLHFQDRVVKRFKWRATNQEAILNAFHEEGWPRRIDDPLPPQLDQDAKRRLSDTIKGLNKKQANSLIRFHGDGTGEGVTWECAGSNQECVGNGRPAPLTTDPV